MKLYTVLKTKCDINKINDSGALFNNFVMNTNYIDELKKLYDRNYYVLFKDEIFLLQNFLNDYNECFLY